ncbi:MAG: hypothetical protein R2774_05550 [Saprospiraceae bacterium]
MRIYFYLPLVLLAFTTQTTFGQTITGKIIDTKTNLEAPALQLKLKPTQELIYTNATGNFEVFAPSAGNYQLVAIYGNKEVLVSEVIVQSENIALGTLRVELPAVDFASSEISQLDLSDLSGDEADDGFSSALSAGRDPFTNASAYNLSNLRFRSRGYYNEDQEVLLNGMIMNDQDDGRVLWNAWSGLNDVFRNQTPILNLASNDYTFGGIGGATNIDIRASRQRKQKKAVYSLSNRNYTHRAMFTYATGKKQNGWAFAASASHRFGSGYQPGTYFQGTSYFLAVDKALNNAHSLGLVVLGSPQIRGRGLATVQEVYNLTNDNYFNSAWGYQNGKVRNSREYRIHQPVMLLTHDWKINTKSTVSTTFGTMQGTFASTNLDWYQAPDPRADYYRKLPSFGETDEISQSLTDYYASNSDNLLVDWQRLYDANASRQYTIYDVDGIEGNNISGKLAAYTLVEDHFDSEKYSLTSVINSVLSSRYTFSGGIQALSEIVHNYRKLDDLLGADFYINYDKFADRLVITNPNAVQNDLNHPNGLVYEGDIYGYNYDLHTNKLSSWGQLAYTGKKFDYFGAAQITYQFFYRDGKMKNGKFPDNSYGKGNVHDFLNFGLKGGVSYKFSGRDYFQINASYRTRAPFATDALLSTRTRDQIVSNAESEKITSAEATYLHLSPSLKGRMTAFYTKFQDQINNITFYLDSDQTFGNLTSTGIGKQHMGVEAGFEKKLNSTFTALVAGSIGEYIYTTRPTATITYDNSNYSYETTLYLKNYYVPGIPQTAGTVGLTYNAPSFWFINVNFNYFDNHYVDMNPLRRTDLAVSDIHPTFQSEQFNAIIGQEKLDDGYTLDLFGGKSWRIKQGQFLALNVSVGNILNNTKIRIGGREQLRFDFQDKNVEKFPPRYFYAYGINYNLNISYRF